MRYLTTADKAKLAEWRAKHPDAPLTTDERALRRQEMEEARQEGTRLGGIVTADNAKTIDAATPDWQKKPRNLAREALAQHERGDGFKTPEVQKRIAQLRDQAAARDAEIEIEMEDKRIAYEVESSPEVVRALTHCDVATKSAAEEDKSQYAELRGLLTGGGAQVVGIYWQRVADLAERAKQRDGEKISETGKALDESYRKYCDSHAAFERSCAAAEASLAELTKGSDNGK